MNSKIREILESLGLIILFNYLWIFIHSYLLNYLFFRPIPPDINIPKSIYLWDSYVNLIAIISKHAIINTFSMFVLILIIIFHKNSNTKFQTIISIFLLLFNIVFSIIISIIFKKFNLTVLNLITYTIYFLVPWVLFLVVYNRYYITGFGHYVIYFAIVAFFFTIFFIMKNNYMVLRENKFKTELAKKEEKILKEQLLFKSDSVNVNTENIVKKQSVPKVKHYKKIVQKYPNIEIYPFKSGIIKYEISGNVTAQETIYFDHYGLRELTLTKTDYGNGLKGEQMILMDNKYIYIIDVGTKIGTIAISNLVNNLSNNPDYNEVLKYRLKKYDPVQFGTGYVLGKNCKIWISKDQKIKFWTWKGLILKKIIYKNKIPSIIYEAKDIQTNITIPESKFDIPKGTKFIRYKKAPKVN